MSQAHSRALLQLAHICVIGRFDVQALVASTPELDTSLDGVPALAMDMLMFHAGESFCHLAAMMMLANISN